MVAIGPTPGSTPTRVPRRQPAKHRAMFVGDSATPSPKPRWETKSNMPAQISMAKPGSSRTGIGWFSA